jgi:hypothetical protein
MNQITSIKVSHETLQRLHRVAGELKVKQGRKVSLEDAINFLWEQNEKNKSDLTRDDGSIKRDREKFLAILAQPIPGSPEDYEAYDFDDIGN